MIPQPGDILINRWVKTPSSVSVDTCQHIHLLLRKIFHSDGGRSDGEQVYWCTLRGDGSRGESGWWQPQELGVTKELHRNGRLVMIWTFGKNPQEFR